MWNAIPVVGWLISLALAISMAIPFWFIWTVLEIGKTYFYFLPEVYHTPGFWATVGIFTVLSILKGILLPSLSCNCNK